MNKKRKDWTEYLSSLYVSFYNGQCIYVAGLDCDRQLRQTALTVQGFVPSTAYPPNLDVPSFGYASQSGASFGHRVSRILKYNLVSVM